MSKRGESDTRQESDAGRGGSEAWTTMKALTDAHQHSMRAMEQYVMQESNDDIELSTAEYEASIERAIDCHERAIEHLKLALEPPDDER